MTDGNTDDDTAAPGPTRRSVMRVGAHAAWSVPVVATVASAPAYAASGGALAVTLAMPERTADTNNRTNLNTLRLTATVTNSGTTTTALTLLVTVTPTTAQESFTGSTASTVAGFAAPERTEDRATTDETFTYVATSQLNPGTPLSFAPTVVLTLSEPGTVTVTALPGGGGTSSSASASFT